MTAERGKKSVWEDGYRAVSRDPACRIELLILDAICRSASVGRLSPVQLRTNIGFLTRMS